MPNGENPCNRTPMKLVCLHDRGELMRKVILAGVALLLLAGCATPHGGGSVWQVNPPPNRNSLSVGPHPSAVAGYVSVGAAEGVVLGLAGNPNDWQDVDAAALQSMQDSLGSLADGMVAHALAQPKLEVYLLQAKELGGLQGGIIDTTLKQAAQQRSEVTGMRYDTLTGPSNAVIVLSEDDTWRKDVIEACQQAFIGNLNYHKR